MYLIELIVKCLLTIMFTQRSNCIGRLQVEKLASLFVQAQNVVYIFHSLLCESVQGENHLSIYRGRYVTNLAATVLANHSLRSPNMKPSWLT